MVLENVDASGLATLHVLTDSWYIYQALTDFLPFWVKDGWTNNLGGPLKQSEEWQQIYTLILKIQVTVYSIKAHQKSGTSWAVDLNQAAFYFLYYHHFCKI